MLGTTAVSVASCAGGVRLLAENGVICVSVRPNASRVALMLRSM
jgi:hypothetical protein